MPTTMSLWSKLDEDVRGELPTGFPRQPSALALARVSAGTNTGAEELLVAIGGDGSGGHCGEARAAGAADAYNLDELCFGDRCEAAVDIWSRPLAPAVKPPPTATPSSSSFAKAWGEGLKRNTAAAGLGFETSAAPTRRGIAGGAIGSGAAAAPKTAMDGLQFERTVLAFPPRPRCGFSLTPLDNCGRRQLLFGGRAEGGLRRGHCHRKGGLGGGGTMARCFADVHVLELGTCDAAGVPGAAHGAQLQATTPACAELGGIAEIELSGSESDTEDIFCADDYRAAVAANRQLHKEQRQQLQNSRAQLFEPPGCKQHAQQAEISPRRATTRCVGRRATGTAALAAAIARKAGRGGDASPSSSWSSTPRLARGPRRQVAAESRSHSSDSTSSTGSDSSRFEGAAPLASVQEPQLEDDSQCKRPASRCAASSSAGWRCAAAGWRLDEHSQPPQSFPTAVAQAIGHTGCDDVGRKLKSGAFQSTLTGSFGRARSQGVGAARWRLPVPVSAAEMAADDGDEADAMRRCAPSCGGRGTLLQDVVAAGAGVSLLPRPRAAHTAVLEHSMATHGQSGSAEKAPSVVIYGGLDDAGMPLGDVHRVQIAESDDRSLKAIWSCLDDGGAGGDPIAPWEQRARPAARACHTAVFCDSLDSSPGGSGTMIVFGGLGFGVAGEAKVLGDTWALDIQTPGTCYRTSGDSRGSESWRRPMLKGGAPACRWGHGACLLGEIGRGGSTMLLCGGIDSSGGSLSDCWVLDLEDMRWECVEEAPMLHAPLQKSVLHSPPPLARWTSLPTPTAAGAAGATPTSGCAAATKPNLGLCTAIWSSADGFAIVWGGQGFFKWHEPEPLRFRRLEREKQHRQVSVHVATATPFVAIGVDGQAGKYKKARKHKVKRLATADEETLRERPRSNEDGINMPHGDSPTRTVVGRSPASSLVGRGLHDSPASNGLGGPDLWMLRGSLDANKDNKPQLSPVQPKFLDMHQVVSSSGKWNPIIADQFAKDGVLPDVIAPPKRRHVPSVDFRNCGKLSAPDFAVPRGMSRISSDPAFHQAPAWLPSISKPLDATSSRFPEALGGAAPLLQPATPSQLRCQLRSRDG